MTQVQRDAEWQRYDDAAQSHVQRLAAELLYRMVWTALQPYMEETAIISRKELQEALTEVARAEVREWLQIPAINDAMMRLNNHVKIGIDQFDILVDVLENEITIEPSREVQNLAIGRSALTIDWVQLLYKKELKDWPSITSLNN